MNWLKRLFGGGEETADIAPAYAAPVADSPVQAPFVAFQPHNELEQLLIDAATNPDARPTFHKALLQAELCVATPEVPEYSDSRIAGEGETLSILNVQSPGGTQVAAIFTAQERIVEVFGMNTGFVAMNGEVLIGIVASGGAWLNPGFPYSVYWTPDQLAAILGSPVTRTVLNETKIFLGVPAEPPAKLVASLKATLGHDHDIAEAWFALAQWPESETSSWYLDVRTQIPREDVLARLADTLKHADYAGRPLDIFVNTPDAREGVGIRVAPFHIH